jgi:hypothetical protein
MELDKTLRNNNEIESKNLEDTEIKEKNHKLNIINKSIVKQQSNIFKTLYLWISDFKDELNKNI